MALRALRYTGEECAAGAEARQENGRHLAASARDFIDSIVMNLLVVRLS